jgi:fructose-bisphosphate aldolase class 1
VQLLEDSHRVGVPLQVGEQHAAHDRLHRVADFELFAVTCPLITTASGAKMGKTAAGAVWLKPEMLSPWDYWQFWRNTADADVERFLKLFTDLPGLMKQANEKHIWGTKMRSVIKEANPKGIQKIVAQQFELGKQIFAHDLVPILEPEVDIHSADKAGSEKMLKEEIFKQLGKLDKDVKVMFKLTIPSLDDFYRDLMDDPHVVRVVALSGGYSRSEANEKLARNHGLIASFSRALAQDLSADQTDEEFNRKLTQSIESIYSASIT